jgi:hypothetical protein
MAADLEDLCDRTERLEEAITGQDGLRVQLATTRAEISAHLKADEERHALQMAATVRVEATQRAWFERIEGQLRERPGFDYRVVAASTGLVTAIGGAVAAVIAAAYGATAPSLAAVPVREPVEVHAPAVPRADK